MSFRPAIEFNKRTTCPADAGINKSKILHAFNYSMCLNVHSFVKQHYMDA